MPRLLEASSNSSRSPPFHSGLLQQHRRTQERTPQVSHSVTPQTTRMRKQRRIIPRLRCSVALDSRPLARTTRVTAHRYLGARISSSSSNSLSLHLAGSEVSVKVLRLLQRQRLPSEEDHHSSDNLQHSNLSSSNNNNSNSPTTFSLA